MIEGLKRSTNAVPAPSVRLATSYDKTAVIVPIGMMLLLIAGCQRPVREPYPQRPNIRPTGETLHTDGASLALDAEYVKPMYTELLPIDLPTIVRVAAADNVDIRQARTVVEASLGAYESAVGRAFPAIVPTALFEHVEGTVRATEGNLVGVGFDTFQPSVAIQWIINPGRVMYDIVAAKKRLFATEYLEDAVVQQTLQRAVWQYYTLALAQARLSAAHQGLREALELTRISRVRLEAGTGVRADELRAQARLAERRQDVLRALHDLYEASVALAVTLHLDPSVTLIPAVDEIAPITLVRADLGIEELIGVAVAFRPDLAEVRTLAAAARADADSAWWRGFGPELALSYEYGGITGHANNVVPPAGVPTNLIVNPASPTGSFAANPLANGLIREGIGRGSRRLDGRGDASFGMHDRQRAAVGLGWKLSLSALGDLRTAGATAEGALIHAERLLEQVRADVVSASQAVVTQRRMIAHARDRLRYAEESLRLAQANLKAGAMTTLDVLQAQESVSRARLAYADAVIAYNQAQVRLVAALGLVSEDLFVPNTVENDPQSVEPS